jgi:hypothetical protein
MGTRGLYGPTTLAIGRANWSLLIFSGWYRRPDARIMRPIKDDIVFLFRRGLAEISTLLQLPAKICRRLQTAYLTIPKADKRGRGFVLPKYRAYAAYLNTD